MSEKRTQNFTGERFFSDFDSVHIKSDRFGIVNLNYNR